MKNGLYLIRAANEDEALARAESEAKFYSSEGIVYLRYAMAFHIFNPPASRAVKIRPHWDGHEVFSLMRESSLSPGEYLDAFFDSGIERMR